MIAQCSVLVMLLISCLSLFVFSEEGGGETKEKKKEEEEVETAAAAADDDQRQGACGKGTLITQYSALVLLPIFVFLF